jgi:hypothetical protein
MKYIKKKYSNIPLKIKVLPKNKGKLSVQINELWSFVSKKGNTLWVWIAIDAKTREIIGLYIGDRSRASAKLRGFPCPPCIANAPSFTPIIGKPMSALSPATATTRWAKNPVKPAT